METQFLFEIFQKSIFGEVQAQRKYLIRLKKKAKKNSVIITSIFQPLPISVLISKFKSQNRNASSMLYVNHRFFFFAIGFLHSARCHIRVATGFRLALFPHSNGVNEKRLQIQHPFCFLNQPTYAPVRRMWRVFVLCGQNTYGTRVVFFSPSATQK